MQKLKVIAKKERAAAYGQYKIDDLIKEEKPDIYLGIEDIWGIESFGLKSGGLKLILLYGHR